ncbi:MAG: HAD hydrolase-like protein [Bacteroidales bacterium]|nr:HAD hydrolase-like protein [Bacteroidales bacterium]
MYKVKYKNIIFDLDGTLTDSKQGIINSVYAACNKLKVNIPGSGNFHLSIGIPLQEYFRKTIGIPDELIDDAVKYFREYYGKKGVYENRLYPGIDSLLCSLSTAARLYIATSKLEKYALVVLDYFNIRKYFRGIAGADASGTHAGKTELVRRIMTRHNLDNGNLTVMIGDKKMDIDAANDCGIESVGITYGYGSVEEIKSSCPTFTASGVEELGCLLLNNSM